MKIVMFCDLFLENLQYQENLIAKYYVKHGHEVVVITSTFDNLFDFVADNYNKNTLPSSYFAGGIKIVKQQYAINFLNKVRKLKNVSKILHTEKPDLIFAHDIYLDIIDSAKYVKNNPNCRLILDYHADYSNSAKNWLSLNILHKIIRKAAFKKARPYISKIFPVVPASAKFLHEVYDVPYGEMELLMLGVDTDLIEEINSNNEGFKIRAKYNIPKDDIVIITGGKLSPFKKTELLIDAFLNNPNLNLHLFVVGDTNEKNITYKNYLLDLAKNNNRVYFTGWINSEDVYRYMTASDIAVFPQSQSVLWQQAIGCGIPLIVGLVGGNEISYLNKFNCIIELKESEITSKIIGEKMTTLIDNKELLKDMKYRAQKTSNEFLNYNNIILKTLN